MEEVKSNVYFAALNAALIVAFYGFVIAGTVFFMKYTQGVDLFEMVKTGFLSAVPFLPGALEFLRWLVEHLIITAFLLGVMYAAYISNYKLRVGEEKLEYREGVLLVDQGEIPVEDIEQVYTNEYFFLNDTKELCIKALEEKTLKLPYVRHAEHVQDEIIARVKEKKHEFEIREMLEEPISAEEMPAVGA